MNKIWFTADHHFGHTNIIENCNRPFSTVEEMDSIMIERWNEVVRKNDMVYHLGDITLYKDVSKYISKLNGHITVIPGNHDFRWMGLHFDYDVLYTKTGIMGITAPLVELKMRAEKTIMVLCHYALRTWNRSHYGSLHLHGHSHGMLEQFPNSMDVGVDCHNFYPISLSFVMENLYDKTP